MALFKILKGLKAKLPTTYNEGYCYVTTDEHKMYIDSSGEASGRFALNAANADSADKLNTSAGSSTKPVYFSGGKPVALSNTIGANNNPIFLSGGSITASNATIGANNKPVYMSSGVITASTQTVGSAALPVYMNGGTITACAAGSIFSALSWTNGDTAGPVISITVAGQNRTSSIPSASDKVSGIITTDKQTIAGAKTFTGAMSVNSSITATGTITAPTFSGALSGNASTATKWQTARTLSWSGDATGSMSVDGTANKSATLTLANSGVTAGSYGPSANISPGVGGTFNVPYFTVDAKGRITSASTKVVTMPTDTKVTNTASTTTKAYITGTTSSTTNTGTQVFDTGVYLSANAGELVATKFTGALNGNASTATSLATTRHLDGVSFNGTANATRYAACSTAAGTVAKTASITSGGFSLSTGARVTVKFSYANTVASPTLNINGTGAKAIYWHGAALASSQYWEAGAVLDFVYNGTQWELIGVAKDNNTTYGFSTSNPTLAWGTTSTIGTAGGVTYQVTMPANPNTNYVTRLYAGASGTNSNSATSNPYIKVTDNNTYRNQVRLIGSGATSVSSDASGNITISSTNTTYSSLKNPYALTIQGNGTTLKTYDGSSAQTVNITPSNIGAAASSHSHSYLPLSGGTLTGVLNCFGGSLKIGSSSESVSMSYNASSDTLTITFP